MTAETVDVVRPGWLWRLSPAGMLVGLLIVGYFPMQRISSGAGLVPMCAALALVGGVVLITLQVGFRQVGLAASRDRFLVILRIGMIRFVVTLVAAASIGWSGLLDHKVFLIWTGIAYVVMTLFETVVLTSWCKRIESRA